MMVYFSELATAFMTALVLENLLFTRAIDIPSLYEKRTPGQIILIGSVLTGIIAVCSIPSYFLNRFLGSQSSALLRRCLPASGTRCRFTASTASPWAR